MQVAERDARVGCVVDGRYRILDAMAAGSMGVVYRAERVPVGKAVAIKFLHAAFASDPEFVGRFERETRVMSKLAHPHCVSVLDFGVDEGAPYLVMDFVSGITLSHILDDGPVEVPRALTLIRQILAGLAHAHEQEIVHRDIKPANLMISEEIGTGPHVRILDFGLARLRGAINATATQSHVVVGTPSYMAPEQTVGSTVDARADLYAVGVVLFEMVTGEKPFRAEDTLELLAMHRGAPVPRLANVAPPAVVVPDGLQEIVDRALAKDPADRFQSAMEFAAAIDELLAGVAPARRTTSAPPELPTTVDLPLHPPEPEVEPPRRISLWFWVALLLLGFASAAYLSQRSSDPPRERPAATPARPAPAPAPAVAADAAPAAPSITVDAAVAPEMVAEADAAVALAPPPAPPDAGGLLIADITLDDAGLPLVDDEPEPDPETAEDPDPLAHTEETTPEDEDEAPDAPEVIVDDEPDPKTPAPPTYATTTAGAVRLIKAGKKELALQSLRRIWPKNKKSAYIPFLLGNLYTDKRWWSVAMDHYRIAIKKNAAYKRNGTLNRNVIRMLASKKTAGKASYFLRKTIGRPAKAHVKSCAKKNKNATIRKRCASIARQIR